MIKDLKYKIKVLFKFLQLLKVLGLSVTAAAISGGFATLGGVITWLATSSINSRNIESQSEMGKKHH